MDDKLGILDIRAKINNSIDCDIEMQLVDQNNIEKRILFYLSKMYGQNMKKGHNYFEANKCIAILFTDFDLKSIAHIKKYITKWNFREEEYKDSILTDALEIYIIEMPKVKKYSKSKKLDTWVNFIIKSGDIDMSQADEPLKKAKKVLEEISKDEHERYLADLREKYVLDQNNLVKTGYDRGFEQGVKDGVEKGIEKGIEQGIQQGSKQREIEIAKEMKKQNYTIEEIQKITNLTKEEIEKL